MLNNLGKFWEVIEERIGFLLVAVLIIAILFAVAVISERVMKKTKGSDLQKNENKAKRLAVVGVFSAISAILMIFEFQLPFIPGFYGIDFSDVPAVVCSFMFGPVAGVTTEFLKILLKLFIFKPTSTAFVGELANFMVGCSFVVPATIIYRRNKTKKMAIVALVTGTLSMTVIGCFINAYVLLPAFAQMYFGGPVSKIIEMGTMVNGTITNMLTFIVFAVVPLNLIKGAIITIITILIYKRLRKLINF